MKKLKTDIHIPFIRMGNWGMKQLSDLVMVRQIMDTEIETFQESVLKNSLEN